MRAFPILFTFYFNTSAYVSQELDLLTQVLKPSDFCPLENNEAGGGGGAPHTLGTVIYVTYFLFLCK
jgi:hypothetical protein